uniref:Uncharacterized protein n=1 Tax=Mesocestoides corti TaxID=53468 RepID=A0A5K3FFZ3_MESCO
MCCALPKPNNAGPGGRFLSHHPSRAIKTTRSCEGRAARSHATSLTPHEVQKGDLLVGDQPRELCKHPRIAITRLILHWGMLTSAQHTNIDGPKSSEKYFKHPQTSSAAKFKMPNNENHQTAK